MRTVNDPVLDLLDTLARAPKSTGPVTLDPAYLRAVERWEALPENAEGMDKGWVVRLQRALRDHFDKARLLP